MDAVVETVGGQGKLVAEVAHSLGSRLKYLRPARGTKDAARRRGTRRRRRDAAVKMLRELLEATRQPSKELTKALTKIA